MQPKPTITFDTFDACDIRVGTILSVEEPVGLRNKAWVMRINFGPEVGQKTSIGQFRNYTAEEMVGKQIVSIVNLPPRQVGKYSSQCLVLGVGIDDDDHNRGHKALVVEALGHNGQQIR